jgi:hypothetical protein
VQHCDALCFRALSRVVSCSVVPGRCSAKVATRFPAQPSSYPSLSLNVLPTFMDGSINGAERRGEVPFTSSAPRLDPHSAMIRRADATSDPPAAPQGFCTPLQHPPRKNVHGAPKHCKHRTVSRRRALMAPFCGGAASRRFGELRVRCWLRKLRDGWLWHVCTRCWLCTQRCGR